MQIHSVGIDQDKTTFHLVAFAAAGWVLVKRKTAERSPVIADSSTEATPPTTSPSPGTMLPAMTKTRSPERSCELGTSSVFPFAR
jgi:hypothetical protein